VVDEQDLRRNAGHDVTVLHDRWFSCGAIYRALPIADCELILAMFSKLN